MNEKMPKRLAALVLSGVMSVGCSLVAAPSAAAADPQPPVISLISPTHGAGFSQNWEIILYATVSDPDGTITKVEFYDGETLLSADTGPLYFHAIRPGVATLGAHTLMAIAYDDQGLTTTSEKVTVYVRPPAIVEITGHIEAGVERGCMLLVPELGGIGAGPYLLLGGDRKVIVPGAYLRVTGEILSGMGTTCMQGIPMRVDAAVPVAETPPEEPVEETPPAVTPLAGSSSTRVPR